MRRPGIDTTYASDADASLTPQATTFAPVGLGVVPLIPITDSLRHFSLLRESRWGFSPVMSSTVSTGDSASSTVHGPHFGNLRGILGTSLKVPERMIVPLERLRLVRGEVLGVGTFGEVLRGELSMLSPAMRQSPAPSMSFPLLTAHSRSNSRTGNSVSFMGHCSEEDQPPTARSNTSGGGGGVYGAGTVQVEANATDLTRQDDCRTVSPENPALHMRSSPSPPQCHPRELSREAVISRTPLCDVAFTDLRNGPLRRAFRLATNQSEVRGTSKPWSSRAFVAADNGVVIMPVAVKRIDKSSLWRRPKILKSFESEVNLTASLSHPCIVKMYGAAEDEAELYLIMEHVVGDTLEKYIKTHGPEHLALLAPRFLADVVLVLEYLHTVGVAHRDVKPCNLLVTADHHVVIVDFGCACYLSDEAANTFAGSAAYMSPEVVCTSKASATSDLWALGCVLFELFAGRTLFHSDSPMLVMRKVNNTWTTSWSTRRASRQRPRTSCGVSCGGIPWTALAPMRWAALTPSRHTPFSRTLTGRGRQGS
ncbi:protein kinase [Trypanosoma rangeli]|uniref:Protein kinase n=1 Tax=Trypanosoma rangeli TaxID=5698 RepID=A0A422NZ64_TRYRA|nr:protein kinase [Trypanosoma rangeli]RNF10767.1 protein kinase [Trypanosoma rangeli]|eukprot:RNF10767.1 protein kinase [Trypanosoma rangeli]